MNEQSLHTGRFLNYLSRDGWEFVRRTGGVTGVAIAAVTADDELVLVEQVRKPLGEQGLPVLELPAGLVGDIDGEDNVLEAANRELIEETGFEAAELTAVCHGPTSAGLTDEVVTLVVAKGLRRVGPGGGVNGEDITVHLVPLAEAAEWLVQQFKNNRLIDPKVWAALPVLSLPASSE